MPKYIISETGKIYSTRKQNYLKTYVSNNGYERVRLYINGKLKQFLVHRLVFDEHVGIKSGLVINHKDGNKLNNRLDNLEAVTQKENILHSFNEKLSSNAGERSSRNKLKNQDILDIRMFHNNGIKIKDIIKLYPVGQSCISNIVGHKRWTHI